MKILNDSLVFYKDKYYCISNKETTEKLGIHFLKNRYIGSLLEQSAYLIYDNNGYTYKNIMGRTTKSYMDLRKKLE